VDFPFSSYEGPIGVISLVIAGGIYYLLKKDEKTLKNPENSKIPEKTGNTDLKFSAIVVLIILAFQVVSYELIALYNMVFPSMGEISAYVDNAPTKGVRALIISFWWVLLASLLIYAGIHNEKKYLHEKRIGMLLLAFALGKILLYDISHLDTNLKVLLFMITGSLILGLSYLRSKKENLSSQNFSRATANEKYVGSKAKWY